MTKLVSLKLNQKFGVLEAQKAEFKENKEGLIEIKAAVGSGKTTLKQSAELAMSAGNTQKLPFDTDKLKNVDVEIELSTGIFMRTYTNKSGNLTSMAYRKLADGKMDKDPVVEGKKLTPAVLRDLIRTDLTFGIDDFLSENPRTHMDFMMEIYANKLTALGVVFDKKSTAYENSILWKLDQAKMERQQAHFARRAVNGFKEALVAEGWDEENVPKITDIVVLESKKQEKIKKESDSIKVQIDNIKEKATNCMMKVISYNDGIKNTEELNRTKLVQLRSDIDTVEKAQKILSFDNIDLWLTENMEIANKPLEPIKKVPMDNEGKIIFTDEKYNEKVDKALSDIKGLRGELIPLLQEQKKDVDTLAIDEKITSGKANNEIVNRWNAYFDWKDADEKVKKLWKEYQAKFAQIDLGVPGLSIQVVGDEESSSIRTHYNGEHNPDFFGNKDGEDRLLTQYSSTQRPIIAILLQIYLLKEKKDGLKMMWIECPVDKKTRDLLVSIQKEHDLTIIVGVTGDFTMEGLEKGQFLIENGELLTL